MRHTTAGLCYICECRFPWRGANTSDHQIYPPLQPSAGRPLQCLCALRENPHRAARGAAQHEQVWLGRVKATTASSCLALLPAGVCAHLSAGRIEAEALAIIVAPQEHVRRSVVMATALSSCLVVLQMGAGFNLPIARNVQMNIV